ncbi:hypothetical protein AB4X15_24740 [Peribacillus simplex]|uniref:hypothetical protein n=1 Tax=Peribacillus TaxID=2675229 RepID=UPI00315CC353
MKIGIPMLTGPVFGSYISKRMDGQAPEGLADQFSKIHNREHPGFGIAGLIDVDRSFQCCVW